MAIRRTLHRTAVAGEKIFDRFLPERKLRPTLEAYRGYATPEGWVVRGRVLGAVRRKAARADQSRWVNFRQMVSLFLTSEVEGVSVRATASGVEGTSDEEGYVTLTVPAEVVEPGWRDVPLALEGTGEVVNCPVLIPDPAARFGVISDVDDTMMETGAYSLARNLWTTFTGSALTRKIFPDSIDLMNALRSEGQAPIYYVSSSPWNLHDFLNRIFKRNDLVTGPMFLRDLGISETQFVTGTHGDHKGDAVDRILAANPDLTFVLIGDTGQHDAEIYGAAAKRHPGRIMAILLREPGPGPNEKAQKAIDQIKADGTPIYTGRTFDGAIDTVRAALDGKNAA